MRNASAKRMLAMVEVVKWQFVAKHRGQHCTSNQGAAAVLTGPEPAASVLHTDHKPTT